MEIRILDLIHNESLEHFELFSHTSILESYIRCAQFLLLLCPLSEEQDEEDHNTFDADSSNNVDESDVDADDDEIQ